MRTTRLTAVTSCVLFFMVIVTSPKVISAAPSELESSTGKTKREAGGPSGLFPFPRIGRSGPDTWFFDTAGKQLFQAGVFDGSDDFQADKKEKGFSGYGHYPRPRPPRIGRRSGSDGVQNYAKRQGLVPFPRIGRSGGRTAPIPGSGPADNNGLWFGPRLGRLQKRDALDSPWALVTLREFPSISSRRQPEAFTPRLGRESNEDFWDYEDHDHQKDHA